MTYQYAIRSIMAAMAFSISAASVAQPVAPPPVQPTLPMPETAPVFVPGSPTELPVKVAPPVTTPPVVSTPPVAAPPSKLAKKKGPTDSLKPGQFVWEKRAAYDGPLKIVAVLDIQRMYVFQNDQLIGFTTISAGKKGKETPTGYFNILQKNIDHKSNLYSNAPMPFMQRLTWDGIALHGGHIPGYPASHGCIRLPQAFAKALFGVTQMDQEVVVLQNTATPIKRPAPKPVPVAPPQIMTPPTAPEPSPGITPPASPPKPMEIPTS